jgi:hypothetical protein
MGIKLDNMSHERGGEVFSATISIGENPALEVILAACDRAVIEAAPRP